MSPANESKSSSKQEHADKQLTEKELSETQHLNARSGRKTTFRLKPKKFYFSF